MRLSESPFPEVWWGSSLDDLGLDVLRPYRGGTYNRYALRNVPPVPLTLGRGLDWLAAAPERECNVGDWLEEHAPGKNAEAAAGLSEVAAALGLTLPEAFVTWISTPALHRRLRSTTDCFLDVGRAPVPSPKGDGRLVRFLCDSQGCVFWYLYLTADGTDHAVVASSDFYGTDEELEVASNWASVENDPEAIVFCGESFEEFLGRFWLENEALIAFWDKTPMPPEAAEYVRLYRERQDEVLAREPIRGVKAWETHAAFVPWAHVHRYLDRYDPDEYLDESREGGSPLKRVRGACRDSANPCPACGRPPDELFCLWLPTPEDTWDAGSGTFGTLTICERCRRQIDFPVDAELTAMQADAWRERRRLV